MNKIGRRKTLRIDSHRKPVRHRSLTQPGRSEQMKYPLSNLRLHWITLTRMDGGPVRGRNKGKWAVSTEGCWTPHSTREEMAHPMGSSYHPEGSAEELWQHWGQLEGGGKSGSYHGNGTPSQGHSLRAENTLIPERSTYSSRRIKVNTSRLDMDLVKTTLPRRQADVTQATEIPPGRTIAAMESLRGPLARCN